ncbi:MAG: hypothetical protein ACREXW_15425 [Gammaproteobacteria bacterium]
MNRQFRILLVEDDPSDAVLALTMVNEVNLAGEAFSLEIKALGQPPVAGILQGHRLLAKHWTAHLLPTCEKSVQLAAAWL